VNPNSPVVVRLVPRSTDPQQWLNRKKQRIQSSRHSERSIIAPRLDWRAQLYVCVLSTAKLARVGS